MTGRPEEPKIGVKRTRENREFDRLTNEVETASHTGDEDELHFNERYRQFEDNQKLIIYKTNQRRKKASDHTPKVRSLVLEFITESAKRKKLQGLPSSTSIEERERELKVIDPKVYKDELDTNTPMWWALQDSMRSCQTTIQKDGTKMFWLGYFLKKRV